MRRQSGFTLVELLLVLAIIGIISAITIPLLMGNRENAREKATEAMAQSVVSECGAAAKMMAGANPAAVIAYVQALPNFTYPRCKNAYIPTIGAVVVGAAVNDGEVGMLAGQQNDSNGTATNVITVSYKHQGTPVPLAMSNVPVE